MDLHTHHTLTRCKYCFAMIARCRCIKPKQLVWSVCCKPECQERGRVVHGPTVPTESAELARLRSENERLRAVVSAALTHDHVVLLGETGPCDICVALAALDQERKEGE